MLCTVKGERGRWGETYCFRQFKGKCVVRERLEVTNSASGKGVGEERLDVTDSARRKGAFGRDVMLQTV